MKRIVRAIKVKKTKRKGDKVYVSEGYMIRFSLPRRYIEKFGEELELEIDEETGEIRLKPINKNING